MNAYIFNENGHLSFIDDIIQYLSIQLEKDDVVKTLISNYYWHTINKVIDLSIVQGYNQGDLYADGHTVEQAITSIEDYLKTVFNSTEDEIKEYKNKSEIMVESNIDGYNEIKYLL